MAATLNVPQSLIYGKSAIPKSGVLTLFGFGVRVRMQNGHLHIEDGVGLKRRTLKLPRMNHGLKRLVCISEDGFATLSALKWLADIGASFVLLNRRGKVLFVTGPTASSDARLRRAQALAFGNAVGLEICRALIDAKLEGQERLMREKLNDAATAEVIAKFRDRLPAADTIEEVRSLEASAAFSYFSAWREIPVLWPTADLQRIATHWRTRELGNLRYLADHGWPSLQFTRFSIIVLHCSKRRPGWRSQPWDLIQAWEWGCIEIPRIEILSPWTFSNLCVRK